MEIYKNKASGKYFIYVRETSNDTALFVNLQGNIKSLNLCLFIEETIEHNEEKLFSQGRLTKVENRLRENVESRLGPDEYDQNRFEQELIYYIEKLDITEEKIRLRKHCDYFLETLSKETSVGKKK